MKSFLVSSNKKNEKKNHKIYASGMQKFPKLAKNEVTVLKAIGFLKSILCGRRKIRFFLFFQI